MAENADDIHQLPLEGHFTGLHKLRVYGNYRLVDELQRQQKCSIAVWLGSRGDLYKE